MKGLPFILGAIALVLAGGTTFGEDVKVKQVPLTWQQVATNDGEELFLELCAVCHGKAAKGDGPAAGALKKIVPDLTGLAAKYDGVFPREKVAETIAGETRVVSHGTLDMPIWGQAFESLRPDLKPFRRRAISRQRIYNLTEYLSTIQAE